MSESTYYAIVGGGIIGLALAYRLTQRFPRVKVSLFEKEPEVGKHQSGHNSGVLHAGLYYKPGSLKAQLAVTGIRQMRAFCERHAIAHDVCGKLVVACSQEEIPRLRDLYDRGQRNGLRGLAWLNADQMREIEPHVAGVAAVRVPEEGIVDYPAVCRTLQKLIVASGGEVLTGTPVEDLCRTQAGWAVNGRPARFLVNTAGLHCDRVLALSGLKRSTRIVPFRGEYYQLSKEGRDLVRNLIYPVPDPRFPFLGVHFTRMIHGGIEAGPNAVLATAREGYRYSDFVLKDVVDTFGYSGFWRFMARYPSMTFFEFKRSLSRSEFCRSLQRLVPAVEERHLAPGGSGVRAQALAPDGTLLQDFEIVCAENALHLINAPSPGATASLAIANYLIDRIAEVGSDRSAQESK
ncbi:MAG: L-2-hydroxyglutarate oxidase [Burkholderiales bacterium]|nr:L-2-hydroxyglutarate oxidase [Burkholderiales bacterium]